MKDSASPHPIGMTHLARRLKGNRLTAPPPAMRPATRPEHVAVVTETATPEVNGVAMTLSHLVDGLIQNHYRVSLVRPFRPDLPKGNPRVPTLAVPGLPIPGYGDLRFGLPARGRLRHHWQQNPPDLVHIATEGPLGWAALGAARDVGAAVTSSFHTHFEYYVRHYGLRWSGPLIARYLRHFHNQTDLTLVPTQALQQELLDRGYGKVGVLGRGIDETRFRPERRSDALRTQWGLAPRDPAILHVGRLATEKNLDLLFACFAAIHQRCPRARLIVVGDGPRRHTLERTHPHVVFTGTKRGDELAAHYASGDVFLFPSLTETYGNVVVEALASGIAVVAFDRGAAAEWIEDGQSGMRIDPTRPQDFIDAAVTLAEHGWLRERLRFHARTRGVGASWTVIGQRFGMFLDQTYQRHIRQAGYRGGWVLGTD